MCRPPAKCSACSLCTCILLDSNDADREHFAEVRSSKNVTRDDVTRSKNILKRFDHNYIERGDEADNVADIIKTSPYPGCRLRRF